MNALQRKELELFQAFLQVCRQLGLSYYLICGSALGAVKYRGFIPWDDDMDLAMLRPEYEVFLAQAPDLLSAHIFLQNYKTDPAFPAIYSKLRYSGTAYIEKAARKLAMHHGIFIDLFPLDGYPAEPARQRRLERRKRHFRRALAAAFSGPPTVSRCFYRLLGSHRRSSSIAAAYERLITQYSPADSALLANHGNWQGARDYAPREEFGPGALAQFEQLPVRLPADYDAYLRRKYGDYWKDPPASRQVSHHSCLFLDTGPKEGEG
mgnify:FL=1